MEAASPLARKLKLKPGLRAAVIGAPAGYLESLDAPPDVTMINALDGHRSMYVLGRGPSLAIAAEAALKLKETCGIHAEAYSSAEVLHGPPAVAARVPFASASTRWPR